MVFEMRYGSCSSSNKDPGARPADSLTLRDHEGGISFILFSLWTMKFILAEHTVRHFYLTCCHYMVLLYLLIVACQVTNKTHTVLYTFIQPSYQFLSFSCFFPVLNFFVFIFVLSAYLSYCLVSLFMQSPIMVLVVDFIHN